MYVATRSFTTHDGYGPVRVKAGITHVHDNDVLVSEHPDAWAPATDRASQSRSVDSYRVSNGHDALTVVEAPTLKRLQDALRTIAEDHAPKPSTGSKPTQKSSSPRGQGHLPPSRRRFGPRR